MPHLAVPVSGHDDEIGGDLARGRAYSGGRLIDDDLGGDLYSPGRYHCGYILEILLSLPKQIGRLVAGMAVNHMKKRNLATGGKSQRARVLDQRLVARIEFQWNQNALVHQKEPPARL